MAQMEGGNPKPDIVNDLVPKSTENRLDHNVLHVFGVPNSNDGPGSPPPGQKPEFDPKSESIWAKHLRNTMWDRETITREVAY